MTHPVLKEVHNGTSGAKQFVDEVEREESRQSAKRESLQDKQLKELQALLDHALREIGATS